MHRSHATQNLCGYESTWQSSTLYASRDLSLEEGQEQGWVEEVCDSIQAACETLETLTAGVSTDLNNTFHGTDSALDDLISSLCQLYHREDTASVVGERQASLLQGLLSRVREWGIAALRAVSTVQPLGHAWDWPLMTARIVALLDQLPQMEQCLCGTMEPSVGGELAAGWHGPDATRLEAECGFSVLRGLGAQRDLWLVAATGYRTVSRLGGTGTSEVTLQLLHAQQLHVDWRVGSMDAAERVSVLGMQWSEPPPSWVRLDEVAQRLVGSSDRQEEFCIGPRAVSLEVEGVATSPSRVWVIAGDLLCRSSSVLASRGLMLPRVMQRLGLLYALAETLEYFLRESWQVDVQGRYFVAYAEPHEFPRWGFLPETPLQQVEGEEGALTALHHYGQVLKSWAALLFPLEGDGAVLSTAYMEQLAPGGAESIVSSAESLCTATTTHNVWQPLLGSLLEAACDTCRPPSFKIALARDRLRAWSQRDVDMVQANPADKGLRAHLREHQQIQEELELQQQALGDLSPTEIALRVSDTTGHKVVWRCGSFWVVERQHRNESDCIITQVRSLDYGWTRAPYVLKLTLEEGVPPLSRVTFGSALQALLSNPEVTQHQITLPSILGVHSFPWTGPNPREDATLYSICFLLMTYGGWDLYSKAAHNLTPQAICKLAYTAALHLSFLHEELQVTHSDFSSGNVLYPGCLIDLDRCTALFAPNWRAPQVAEEEHPYAAMLHPAQLTHHQHYAAARSCAGTPPFVSPERLRHGDQAQGPAGDIYAWGVTFAALLLPDGDSRTVALRHLYPDEVQKSEKAWAMYRQRIAALCPHGWSRFASSGELVALLGDTPDPALECLVRVVDEALSPHPLMRPSAQEILARLQEVPWDKQGVEDSSASEGSSSST